MGEIEFKVAQRRWFMAGSAAGFVVALGAALILATGVRFVRLDVVWMFGPVGLLFGLAYLDAALGRTVLTKTGFTTRSLFGRQHLDHRLPGRREADPAQGGLHDTERRRPGFAERSR